MKSNKVKRFLKYYTPELPNADILVTLEFIVEVIRDDGHVEFFRGGREDCREPATSIKKMLIRGTIVQFAPSIPYESGKVPRLDTDGKIYYVSETDANPIQASNFVTRVPPEYDVDPPGTNDRLLGAIDEFMEMLKLLDLTRTPPRANEELERPSLLSGDEWKRDTFYDPRD